MRLPHRAVAGGRVGAGRVVYNTGEYIRAGSFVRDADPGSLIAAGGRIIVDGLDEIASAAAGGAVEAVLKQLYAWLKSTLEKIAAGHPQSRVHGLLPWAFDQASN